MVQDIDGTEESTERTTGDYDYVEPDNSRFELEFSDIISSVKHSLKNEERNDKGVWIKIGRPLMNKEGISHFLSYLKLLMHKGTPLANTRPDYVFNYTQETTLAYKEELIALHSDWELDKEYIKTVALLFGQNIFNVLSRSMNDRERTYRKGRFPSQEQYKHDEVNPAEIRL